MEIFTAVKQQKPIPFLNQKKNYQRLYLYNDDGFPHNLSSNKENELLKFTIKPRDGLLQGKKLQTAKTQDILFGKEKTKNDSHNIIRR